MLTAELRIEDGTAAEIDQLLAGCGEVQITVVSITRSATVAGHEMHDLAPLRIEALTPTASSDPAVAVCGALVRVYVQPEEEN